MRIIHYIRAINAENIKNWKIDLSYKPDFIRQFIEPFIYLLPYFFYGIALVGGRYSENLKNLTNVNDMISYIFIGYIIMGFLNTACWAMGSSLRKEQFFGTLETVFSAPVPRWVYVAGTALHSTLHQGLIMIIQAISITIFFRITFNIKGIFPSLIILMFMLFALYGLGILIAGLTIGFKQWWVFSEIISTFVSVLTPIAYPLSVLPVIMKKTSLFFPTTYGVLGIRHFLLGENIEFSFASIIIRLNIIILVWFILGVYLFIIMDKLSRKKGFLSTY
uniref:Transport permease protein n=1 Tax=candidate division WOR-3 bacterium TaxID=2052148 RepID=A0A7C4Y579_UNCW3